MLNNITVKNTRVTGGISVFEVGIGLSYAIHQSRGVLLFVAIPCFFVS